MSKNLSSSETQKEEKCMSVSTHPQKTTKYLNDIYIKIMKINIEYLLL